MSKDIEIEKTNGKSIKIDLDPWEYIIIGIVCAIIAHIIYN